MARAKAAAAKDPKALARATKDIARKKPKASASGGSPMFKLLFYLAILAGVGYAATRITIGGQTAAEHARELVRWDAVKDKGSQLGRAATDAVKRELSDADGKSADKREPAKPAPAKPAPAKAAAPEKKPAPAKVARTDRTREEISSADRAALDRLLQ